MTAARLHRRQVIAGLGAGVATAGHSAPPRTRPLRIATEESFTFPEMAALLHEYARFASPSLDHPILRLNYGDLASPLTRALLDVDEGRLTLMDAAGVDMQLLSLNVPGVQLFEAPLATTMAREANDRLAAIIARHPGRYAGLAAFAPQDPAAAAREMERAVTSLGLNGFLVNSHTGNEYLDDPKFWPILEAAEALDRPLYLHPRAPSDGMAAPFRVGEGGRANGNIEGAAWGFAAETSIHALRLILTGVLDRFPRLRLVLGHMGETIPFGLWRLDYMASPPKNRRIRLKPSDYVRRSVAITTSGVEHHPALAYCLDVLGDDAVMWAVDHPYQSMATAVTFLETAPIAASVRAKVFSGNARRLFRIDAPAMVPASGRSAG